MSKLRFFISTKRGLEKIQNNHRIEATKPSADAEQIGKETNYLYRTNCRRIKAGERWANPARYVFILFYFYFQRSKAG